MSWAQGVARHEVEGLPHHGKHVYELPREGEHKPEGPPSKSKHMAKASPKSGCCQQVKAKASPSATWGCHHEGLARAQGPDTNGQTQTRSAATIGQANVKSTRRRKEAQTRVNAGVGAKHCKNMCTSVLHSQGGTRMWVPWPAGTLEGGYLEGKSSKSKRRGEVDEMSQRAPSPATR